MTGPFIRTDGMGFTLHGRPYRFTGTNMWFGAYLGAAGPGGQRDRLCRELDLLAACGITNVRIMASSESSVLPAAVRSPILRTPDETDEDLLCGLDFLLAELAVRRMHAVLYLTNFWDWSGGMSSYVAWTDGGAVPATAGGDGSWAALVEYTASFYANVSANALYRAQVHRIVTRTNTITGGMYRDDQAIMAWQLANEPRPGLYGPSGEKNIPAFMRWLAETATYIHDLDPNHLVSTGSEGTEGCLGSEGHFLAAHRPQQIDYLTFHLWPYNWRWFDPQRADETIGATREKSEAYIAQHCELARRLGKPIVLEEFGLTRDGGAVDAGSVTTKRDGFFDFIGGLVLGEMRSGSPLAGSNFWTWAGEGRPDAQQPAAGLPAQAPGDPPHEPQGLNSVYDTDITTLAVLRNHASTIEGFVPPGSAIS
jgi:mannan endo-1,4-beta-mannosidase